LDEEEYNPLEMALKLAKRKKIGPYRLAENRREFRQKDMGTLVRAGFDYDTVCEVLDYAPEEE
jgi:regulatory protein